MHCRVQASKLSSALNVERQQGGRAALEDGKASQERRRQELQKLEEQQAAARSSAGKLESAMKEQVRQPSQLHWLLGVARGITACNSWVLPASHVACIKGQRVTTTSWQFWAARI